MTVQERLDKTKDVYSQIVTTAGVNIFYDQMSVEHDLQSWAMDMLATAGAYVIRNAWATRRGVADLTVCFNGKFIAIELKDNEGAPSAHQRKHIANVIAAGGIACVCRTLSEVFDCLQKAVS